MMDSKLLVGTSSPHFSYFALVEMLSINLGAHLGCVVDHARVGVVVNPGTVAAVDVLAPLVVVIAVVVIHLVFFLFFCSCRSV